MPNVVYWNGLPSEDRSAVLTEAIRCNHADLIAGDDPFDIASWIIEQFVCYSSVFPHCGELWVDPCEIISVSSVWEDEYSHTFDLVFSHDDLNPDFSRFLGFDLNEDYVDAFEPVLSAFAYDVPFDDIEWPDGLDLDRDLDSFEREDFSLLVADFANRVSTGDPCDLSTWHEAIASQVNSIVSSLLFCSDDALCRFDVTWWVSAFIARISSSPFYCSSLDCDISYRS